MEIIPERPGDEVKMPERQPLLTGKYET